MNIGDLKSSLNPNQIGQEIYEFIAQLYPICRSITGNGLRETLGGIQRHVPITVCEVATGTQVFDWTIPKEWNIKDAYIKNLDGARIIDFHSSNLHVVNYSIPVHKRVTLSELKSHLYSLPEHPNWIPYRTSYYKEDWGFCLSHNQLLAMKDGEYEVCIESSLEPGHLSYGEYFLQGETPDEVLISCHVCHPSLCNDNLSGISLVTFLAKSLGPLSLRYSYRFLFIPGTIGSITWLAQNEDRVSRIKHGLVIANVGDSGRLTYKKSRSGAAEIDSTVTHVLRHSGKDFEVMDFSPYGYDERQFCSPGFNLPVGCLNRTPYGRFPEYHTSADNLDFVQPRYLGDSCFECLSVLSAIESNKVYRNLNPKCEPQLGKRGLYRALGGQRDGGLSELSMLWVLNLSDGQHTLLDIAEKSGSPIDAIEKAAKLLLNHGLLQECNIGDIEATRAKM